MPIINYKDNKQVDFGTGDVLISHGLLQLEDEVVGVLCFTNEGSGAIGERIEYPNNKKLEADEIPVRLTFTKIESIDSLIDALVDTKELMIAKSQVHNPLKMQVAYIGKMDFYDGLTTGKVYAVIEETETKYVVMNDLGATSTISKEKFEIMS